MVTVKKVISNMDERLLSEVLNEQAAALVWVVAADGLGDPRGRPEIFLDDLTKGVVEVLLAKPPRREIVRAFAGGDVGEVIGDEDVRAAILIVVPHVDCPDRARARYIQIRA